MNLKESAQMYLETILILLQKNGSTRAIDVGEYMGYTKPSVSRAMGLLRSNGYIKTDAEGYITLTESGAEIAGKVYERHRLLTEFLVHLGVNPEVAADDACKMEHDISDESFEALKRHAMGTKHEWH